MTLDDELRRGAQARAEAAQDAIKIARQREKAETKAAAALQARVEAERKSEALAAERAEAESRATATLQARISMEEMLTRKALDAAEAKRGAAQAAQQRTDTAAELGLARAAHASAEKALSGGGSAWLIAPVAAVAVAIFLGLLEVKPLADSPAATPLALRLDYRLQSYKP